MVQFFFPCEVHSCSANQVMKLLITVIFFTLFLLPLSYRVFSSAHCTQDTHNPLKQSLAIRSRQADIWVWFISVGGAVVFIRISHPLVHRILPCMGTSVNRLSALSTLCQQLTMSGCFQKQARNYNMFPVLLLQRLSTSGAMSIAFLTFSNLPFHTQIVFMGLIRFSKGNASIFLHITDLCNRNEMCFLGARNRLHF